MEPQSAYLERLRPPGGRRSSKRELIVNTFIRQQGHLSADDLVGLIRSEDHRISRATVYRTLQWMVEAGIARKVDFGEGRFGSSIPIVIPGIFILSASHAIDHMSFSVRTLKV